MIVGAHVHIYTGTGQALLFAHLQQRPAALARHVHRRLTLLVINAHSRPRLQQQPRLALRPTLARLPERGASAYSRTGVDVATAVG
jgi:hypothetical protein